MATRGKRRALGQHFLKDRDTARLIVDTALAQASTTRCRSLLEIGPGKGALTLPLMEGLPGNSGIEEFILCERDREIASRWRAHPSAPCPLRIETGDFLDLPEKGWISRAPVAVVSNLPYSAGTAILTRLASHPESIPVMVLMFQAEVAKRLRAELNTKEWGSLSIWVQNRWDVTRLCAVPPGAFSPPPDVNSEVVVLKPRPEPRIRVPDEPQAQALWESLLKTCFSHRRKMLRSGLPATGGFRNALALSGLDGTKRAEALQWDEWEKLYRALLSERD